MKPTEAPIDTAQRVSKELDAIVSLVGAADDLHCVDSDAFALLLGHLQQDLEGALKKLEPQPQRLHLRPVSS